jgi:hypothetical protein
MNLRDQLKEILPDILPRNPAQAIKGTELIEMVKHRLKQEYSDATLRYHFSIMSCDPSSPIAKVEQGQGYYMRTSTIHSLNSARHMFRTEPSVNGEHEPMGSRDLEVSLGRAEKFRAVVQRYLEAAQQFPFAFQHSFSSNAEANRWRVPDLAVLDWLTGSWNDEDYGMDKRELEVRRRLGQSPLRISTAKLRLDLHESTLLEDLHQTLAVSEWANAGELLVAASITNQAIIDEVRRFASRYGVGVISFGLDSDILDDMPEPAVIENLQKREFESIQSLLQVRRYASPRLGESYDWQQVAESGLTNPDFERFGSWVSRCLLDERIMTAREFEDLERGSRLPSTQEYVA